MQFKSFRLVLCFIVIVCCALLFVLFLLPKQRELHSINSDLIEVNRLLADIEERSADQLTSLNLSLTGYDRERYELAQGKITSLLELTFSWNSLDERDRVADSVLDSTNSQDFVDIFLLDPVVTESGVAVLRDIMTILLEDGRFFTIVTWNRGSGVDMRNAVIFGLDSENNITNLCAYSSMI